MDNCRGCANEERKYQAAVCTMCRNTGYDDVRADMYEIVPAKPITSKPRNWNADEWALYQTLTCAHVADIGWVPSGDVRCDQLTVWIYHEGFHGFLQKLADNSENGVACHDYPASVQERHVMMELNDMFDPDRIDLEKLFPKDKHMRRSHLYNKNHI